MAGIGFEIKKLMDEQTYTGDFKAYFFAGIISSGPWVVSILGMGILWMLSGPTFLPELQRLFRVVVVYTYAYSLILTGFIQFILNRFLSDKLFLKQRNIFLPTYVGVIVTTILIQGAIATVFYGFSNVDLYFKILGVLLFIAVSCIWQTMIFLTASRNFVAITAAFFWGNFIGLLLAVVLGKNYGFYGHLFGFTMGQAAILFFLMYRVFFEFYSVVPYSFEFLRYIRKYFSLFLIGVFYYLAMWSDKIIYWYSPTGEHQRALFYSNFPYDSCMFLAFMTIIPALAHFMVDVDTNFYEAYKGFYGSIINKGSWREIKKKKKEMMGVLFETSTRMVMLQTIITIAFLCFAPLLAKVLHLGDESVRVLWAGGVGTYFHVILLISLILILYFDRRRAAIAVAAFFLVTNVSFTLYVIKYAHNLMGVGYAASTFLTAIFAIILLYLNVRNIEYLTFIEQPLLAPKLAKTPIEEKIRVRV